MPATVIADLIGWTRDRHIRLRAAEELAGCSHHTVAEWGAKRDVGSLPDPGGAAAVAADHRSVGVPRRLSSLVS
jgi:hypothetical protein